MSTQAAFDPAAFKTTTRRQWQEAAEAWHRWGSFIGSWLGDATEAMIEMAGIDRGHRVVDVAAGAGEQSLRIARQVGPQGRVLVTDIAPDLLDRAAADAAAEGLGQVETLELDGEALDTLEPGSFDAVVSRVGLIYFPDQQRALRGALSALRPGGRIGAVVYSTPDANAFFSIPVGIIRARAALPPPLPGQPGPFSLGGPGVLAGALEARGVRGRGGAHGAVARRAAVGAGVRALPAGVVRRAPPDDGGADPGRAGGHLARGGGRADPLRGCGRVRRTLRDAGGRGHRARVRPQRGARSSRAREDAQRCEVT